MIKFRAWDIHKKRMLKVYRLSFDGPIEGVQVHCYLDDRGAEGSTEYSYDGDGLILEQFTGLKDANDKEIYEGDIVRIDYHRAYGENWDMDSFAFIDYDYTIDVYLYGAVKIWPSSGVIATRIICDEPEQFNKEHPMPRQAKLTGTVEVVGNIYDNPELLEDKKHE